MSSGQKQCAMDDEEAARQERLKLLKQMDPNELLRIFTEIKMEWHYLKPHDLSLTQTQHGRLEQIGKGLRKLP